MLCFSIRKTRWPPRFLTQRPEIPLGREKTGRLVTALDAVPFGFKIAVSPMKKGSLVIKYGLPIGVASRDIAPGSLVHIHNIEGARGRGDLKENAK